MPLIVRKQEGGYGYAATDLAALRQRVQELHATRLIYVVGAPQAQHLAMVFATARLAGWADDSIRLEHVAFGSVLGPDKKMLKTRAGDSVALADLLSEAVARATEAVAEKAAELPAEEKARIARGVGIGAVKYADLANDRIKDYVFDWKRMLAFDGNTAPYLMYAHARIRSILRKATEAGAAAGPHFARGAPGARPRLGAGAAGGDARPRRRGAAAEPDLRVPLRRGHRLHRVLRELPGPEGGRGHPRPRAWRWRKSRPQTLALGLGLLGIAAPDQM